MARKLQKAPQQAPPKDGKGAIVFFHPDLGIGGAERLVVDAAVGLQENGHRVVIFTNHCDPNHCFDECRDGTLDVRVRANRIVPPSVFSRLTILCAILRHILLLVQIFFTGELANLYPRAFVVDQLSAGLPILRIISPSAPILFYCHFPDLLLARGRESPIKRLYRVPFDFLEQWTMGFAAAVAVNSNFTKGVVNLTWPGLESKTTIKVVYPCVDTDVKVVEPMETVLPGEKLVLSINRFEEKKDIALAIKAFAAIPEAQRKGARLILAGGYDVRVTENVTYHAELQALATKLGLEHHTTSSPLLTSLKSLPQTASVLFLLSIPNVLKQSLLFSSRLLVYTPSNEHFGIVPLEAMLSKLPVLACNTGGPVETIVDGVTGWLRSPGDVEAWTKAITEALGLSNKEVTRMGEQGEKRVKEIFGRSQMANNLEDTVNDITAQQRAKAQQSERSVLARFLNIGAFFALGIGISFWMART